MSRQKSIEIWVGIFVFLSMVALAVIAFQVSNFQGFKEQSSYRISALFMDIGGLKERSAVKMSGVVIGRVESISIDQESFQAKVIMNIYSQYSSLPTDTSASILTSGLLGDQYVGLEPGGEEEYLENGDQLELTQPALVLENLIGQFLTKFAESSE